MILERQSSNSVYVCRGPAAALLSSIYGGDLHRGPGAQGLDLHTRCLALPAPNFGREADVRGPSTIRRVGSETSPEVEPLLGQLSAHRPLRAGHGRSP